MIEACLGSIMKKRILFLCKRRPQQRDLLKSPYGRFYYLPYELSKLGHEVTIALFSHNKNENCSSVADGISWHSMSTNPNPISAYFEIRKLTKELKPDWIVGFSDTYYGILAVSLAKTFKTRSILDAYDNYAAYIPWAKPLHALWFRAARQADILTAAGPSIADLFQREAGRKTTIVPMSADPSGFYFRDRFKCRQMFNLPADAILVGYSGAISNSRDIRTLFDAVELLRKDNDNIRLVLSGRVDAGISIPKTALNAGFVATDKLPYLISAVDVVAVVNKNSSFGIYSYPIKLYEAMASGLRVVASQTPATKWILANHSECLVGPEDPIGLSQRLQQALAQPPSAYEGLPNWQDGARIIDALIDSN